MSPDQGLTIDAAQEEWRPVKHYEGMYSVSNLGRVRSEDRVITSKAGRKRSYKGQLLRYNTNGRGLLFVTLCWSGQPQSLLVHDLVARAFLGPRPEGLVVKHGPGGKLDNRPENLFYGLPMRGESRSELLRRVIPKGEKHWHSKLNEQAVRVIRALPQERGTATALAKAYGVSEVTIRNVIAGRTWNHVT